MARTKPSPINWTLCKSLMLDAARTRWNGRKTRVAGDVKDYLERIVCDAMDRLVNIQTPAGKTIVSPSRACGEKKGE